MVTNWSFLRYHISMNNYREKYPESSYGIVLKKQNLSNYKNIILDKSLGRIECLSPKNKPLFNGAYIEYNIRKTKTSYFLENVNIIDIPDYWIKNDFLFFHYILDICNLFLPLDLPVYNNIFEFIRNLYTKPEILSAVIHKKIFLYYLFNKMGLITEILDSILLDENKLDKFLLNCVNSYSITHKFYTQKFLFNNTNKIILNQSR